MSEPAVSSITLEACHALSDIPRDTWERLAGTGNPFLRYEFFEALESTRCTSEATGWKPSHLIFRMGGEIAGVAPAYLKSHSMGEYVFDWAWADAYRRYDMDYYPKLLIAVPFTPSQGPRLLLDPQLRSALDAQSIHDLFDALIAKLGAHSWHLLFPNEQDQQLLQYETQLHRIGCQFHWRNKGYGSFDDFLGQLTSRKRKSIRKERRQVAEQDITFARFHGRNISDQVLAAFYVFYQATYLKRGQQPYLTRLFFEQMRETMPEHLHVIVAVKDGEMIAGALFLAGQNTLYGRYWGCLEEYSHLHFETCYYQGIELAIELGLQMFDAGAQGEHKLVRGFEPVITHSWHGIAHPGFRDAIAAFTREEAEQIMGYYEEAETALPFRQTSNP
ncbi:GNAT family N-acetyltransferase [Marinobacter sediminicola]|uniref:GNAT family N-acetyltransferase n=1 Tax=Marinobacter sediminicola TaxID=3072994 RepID=UPI0028114C88|nr:GNAT family N-acetyltransferase [Marinobacter sp. F26243]